jgi:putative endonuclease
MTNNIDKRFIEHQDGIDSTCYTFKRRPLELVYTEMYIDVNQAIAREKQLKGWSRRKKEALIAGELNELLKFSKKEFKK